MLMRLTPLIRGVFAGDTCNPWCLWLWNL